MLGIVLAVSVGAGAVATVARSNVRTGRARPSDAVALRRALSSTEPEVVEAALRVALGEAAAPVHHALSGGRAAQAIAALNEALADVDGRLTMEEGRSTAAARVAFAGGTLGGVLELSRAVGAQGGGGYALAGAAFLFGCVSAGLGLELGRRAASDAASIRREWDQIAALVGRRIVPGHGPEASIARRTWASRRSGR